MYFSGILNEPFKVKCELYKKRCIPKGDFQKTKDIKSEQPITTGKICGFKKFDKVKYLGKEYFIKGRMSIGYAILMDIDGNKVEFSKMSKGYKTPKLSNYKRVASRKSVMVTRITIYKPIHLITKVKNLLG